jgi:hypothetical protein
LGFQTAAQDFKHEALLSAEEWWPEEKSHIGAFKIEVTIDQDKLKGTDQQSEPDDRKTVEARVLRALQSTLGHHLASNISIVARPSDTVNLTGLNAEQVDKLLKDIPPAATDQESQQHTEINDDTDAAAAAAGGGTIAFERLEGAISGVGGESEA